MKDVQNSKSNIKIELDSVGVRNVIFPMKLLDQKRKVQNTIANIELYVDLPKDQKGTHMSRFIEILNYMGDKILDQREVSSILKQIKKKFKCKIAYMDFSSPYFIDKVAPISKKKSKLHVEVRFKSWLNGHSNQDLIQVKVPITSLCPCSKEISEYGAHNQRGFITIQTIPKKFIWIEELVEIAEKNASCEIYPLLKRSDEKYVTEKAYNNPAFVEDLVRKVSKDLLKDPRIGWFKVIAENQESIHTHNAFATYERKNNHKMEDKYPKI
jgi:GTP cyclohydrolase I